MYIVFQLSLITGEEVEIEYEVDGWYYVSSDLTIDFFVFDFKRTDFKIGNYFCASRWRKGDLEGMERWQV